MAGLCVGITKCILTIEPDDSKDRAKAALRGEGDGLDIRVDTLPSDNLSDIVRMQPGGPS